MATGIVRRNDSASEIASREAARLVYGATSPYGRQPEIATMMSVTVADLKAWHERTVIPNGMIIGVSGDFDSAAMEKTLRAAFETLPEGKPVVEPKEAFPGPKPGVYFVDKSDVNQSNVRIVGLGTERSNPDYYALSIMNEIFSGGFGSRLFQDVRTNAASPMPSAALMALLTIIPAPSTSAPPLRAQPRSRPPRRSSTTSRTSRPSHLPKKS